MKIQKSTFLFSIILFFIACSENNTGPEMITEHAGSAHYYINNQSDIDFNVLYKNFGSEAEQLITVPVDNSVKIFEDGSFGNKPTPSITFDKILFYNLLADSSEPVLIINPITDEEWNIIGKEGFEYSSYGLTEYELVITDEDIK